MITNRHLGNAVRFRSDVEPHEVKQCLKSEEFSEGVTVLTSHWGANNLREHTLAAFAFTWVVNSIYMNEDRHAKLSRPFGLEVTKPLPEECNICNGDTARADLALLERGGDTLLWIEIKRLDHDNQITPGTLHLYKCDIVHASKFPENLCIFFCQSRANFGGYEQELHSLANDNNVELHIVTIGGS